MSRPKISVVIPSYNAEAYIGATLSSIVKQNYDNLEVILSDGGSTDGTLRVVEGFQGLAVDVRSSPDRGQLDAVIRGVSKVTGDIVLWMNADDIIMPGAFNLVSDIFSKNPDLDYVFSDDFAFNEENRTLSVGATIRGLNFWDHFLFYRQMYSECVYWRVSSSPQLDEDYLKLRIRTDYGYLLNMRFGKKGKWVRKRLGAFRIREGQLSQTQVAAKESELNLIRQKLIQRLGWSWTVFAFIRTFYAPWFFIRQVLYPILNSGSRFACRKMTGDRARKSVTKFFYGEWLLP